MLLTSACAQLPLFEPEAVAPGRTHHRMVVVRDAFLSRGTDRTAVAAMVNRELTANAMDGLTEGEMVTLRRCLGAMDK